MNLTTGIDLIEIKRMKHSMEHPRFLTRVFSHAEIELFAQKNWNVQTIAANFCAKEAFSKALGTGIRGFALTDVSVLRDELGAPYFVLENQALKIVQNKHMTFSLSLTHTEEYAAAFVVGYQGE